MRIAAGYYAVSDGRLSHRSVEMPRKMTFEAGAMPLHSDELEQV
jgi:hypothetical protein